MTQNTAPVLDERPATRQRLTVSAVLLSPDKTYAGLLDHEKMFRTKNGKSFKCKSDNLLLMSSQLQVKLVPMQMQAFTLPNGRFGKGDCGEWWMELPETCLMFAHVFLLKRQPPLSVPLTFSLSSCNPVSQRWSAGLTTTSG